MISPGHLLRLQRARLDPLSSHSLLQLLMLRLDRSRLALSRDLLKAAGRAEGKRTHGGGCGSDGGFKERDGGELDGCATNRGRGEPGIPTIFPTKTGHTHSPLLASLFLADRPRLLPPVCLLVLPQFAKPFLLHVSTLLSSGQHRRPAACGWAESGAGSSSEGGELDQLVRRESEREGKPGVPRGGRTGRRGESKLTSTAKSARGETSAFADERRAAAVATAKWIFMVFSVDSVVGEEFEDL